VQLGIHGGGKRLVAEDDWKKGISRTTYRSQWKERKPNGLKGSERKSRAREGESTLKRNGSRNVRDSAGWEKKGRSHVTREVREKKGTRREGGLKKLATRKTEKGGVPAAGKRRVFFIHH